ncbi:hypothetical protein ACKLNR_005925 [Fusarium oxysporum f. sp. zingiberi]
MGLFASDSYWHTDWDRYLHSETFLEDVPPLVVCIMEAIGIAASFLSLVNSSMRAVQYLHCRMDNEHENYLRSLGKLEDVIDRIRTKLPKVNGIITKDLEETIDPATKRAIEDVGSTMQLLDRVLHDTGTISSRAATWGTRRPNYTCKTTSARSRELAQVSQEITTFVGLLDTFQGADHYALDPPFYDFGNSSRSIFDDVEAIKPGGTSQVFRVGIHLSHIPDYGRESRKEVAFAVKKIYYGTPKDYARERDAYQRLSLAQNPHPHIVPLLASYRMESKYHLVFPLADCDLAMYWRSEPKPSNDNRTLEWFGSQMRGLADALSTVHGQNSQEKDLYGVHGDIKPENILCFGSDNKWTTFALADFGSSYFLTPEEKDMPKGLKHTPVYRAPELDTTGGMTQACDIWSLGCVFTETIIWFCHGKDGISKLIQTRLDDEDNSPNRDAFFRLQYDKRGGLTAKLKPEVHRLLISLRESCQSSLFIDDMLYLVLEGMLKVNMSERMSAREIFEALTQMCLKLESDPAYSEPRGTNDMEMYRNYLRNRGVEEYAAKLAKMGINVTLEAASKLLELQVKDLETFDETMREPVRAYRIPTDAGHEKTRDSAPSGLSGSSDLMGQFQLLARFEDDKDL